MDPVLNFWLCGYYSTSGEVILHAAKILVLIMSTDFYLKAPAPNILCTLACMGFTDKKNDDISSVVSV